MSSNTQAFIEERKKLQCIVVSCLGKAVQEAKRNKALLKQLKAKLKAKLKRNPNAEEMAAALAKHKDDEETRKAVAKRNKEAKRNKNAPATATDAHDEEGGEEGACTAIMPSSLCSLIEDMSARLENDFPIFDSKDEEYEKGQLVEAMRLFKKRYLDSLANSPEQTLAVQELLHPFIKMFFMANIPFYALDKKYIEYGDRENDSEKEMQEGIQISYLKQLTQHLPAGIITHHFTKAPVWTRYNAHVKILYDKKIKKQKQYNSKPSNEYVVQLVNESNQALELALKVNNPNNSNLRHPIQVLVTEWRKRINKGYVYCDTQEKQSEAVSAVKVALTYGNLDALIPFLHVMIPIYAAKHFFKKIIFKPNYTHWGKNQSKSQIADVEKKVVEAYKKELVNLHAKNKQIQSAIEFDALVVFLMHPLHHTSKFLQISTLDQMRRKLGGLIHAYRTGQTTSNEKEELEALVKDSQTGQSPPSAEYVVALQLQKENLPILLNCFGQDLCKEVGCLLEQISRIRVLLKKRVIEMENQLDVNIGDEERKKNEIDYSKFYQALVDEEKYCANNEKYSKGKKGTTKKYKKNMKPFKEKAALLRPRTKAKARVDSERQQKICHVDKDVVELIPKILTELRPCTSAMLAFLEDTETMYRSINGKTVPKIDFLKILLEIVPDTINRVGKFVNLLKRLRRDRESRKSLVNIRTKLHEFGQESVACMEKPTLLLQGDGQIEY